MKLNQDIAMQLIKPKQVWFANFPFQEDESITKDRPVLVLTVDKTTVEVISVKITTPEPRTGTSDFRLSDWQEIPLDHLSTIQPSQIRAIPVENFRRMAGILSEADWDRAVLEVKKEVKKSFK